MRQESYFQRSHFLDTKKFVSEMAFRIFLANVFIFLVGFLGSNALWAQEKTLILEKNAPLEKRLAPDWVAFYESTALQDFSPAYFLQDSLWAKNQTLPAHFKPRVSYFFKIKLLNQNPTQTRYLLTVPPFDSLEALLFDSKQKVLQSLQTGLHVPLSKRNWQDKSPALLLEIPAADTLTLLLRARNSYQDLENEGFIVQIPEVALAQQAQQRGRQLFFRGAFLLMFFYNLFFFFIVRDKAYFYYAFYILGMAIVGLEDTFLFVWEEPILLTVFTNFAALFVTLLYTQFIRYFLHIPQIRPQLNRYFRFWVYFRLLTIVLALLYYHDTPRLILENAGIQVLFLIDILGGLVLIGATWKVSKVLTTYIVLGYLAMTLPLFFAILKEVIFSSANPDTDGVVVQVGVLVELIVFSLGLGYRSKEAEREKLVIAEENRRIIAQQNLVLEEKVEQRTQELQIQKRALEEQNLHITQNINYARRIQEAFLPKREAIESLLPEFFILFKPRDIVSGDFYFVEKVGEKIVVAAIDCTGHGVSGAFMTVLGNEILHKIVRQDRQTSPDLILNALHKGVREALQQAHTANRDGMDLSLIVIDTLTQKIEFAGAKNPLLYFNHTGLHLLKGDKMPIGGEQREQERLFTKKSIDTTSPTVFYLLSDGFQDQFGGENNRKFGIARLKKLLEEIATEKLTTQAHLLDQAFESWREQGGEAQIDDVLILGLKW